MKLTKCCVFQGRNPSLLSVCGLEGCYLALAAPYKA